MDFLEPGTHIGYQLPVSNTLSTEPLSSCSNEFVTDGIIPSTLNPCVERCHSSEEDVVWNPTWRACNASIWDYDGRIDCLDNLTPTSLHATQKKLLKLNLELIEDTELLEWESTAQASMNLFGDNMSTMVGKLDIPIFRMLNHSTRLLEIFDSERYQSDGYTRIHIGTEFVEKSPHAIVQSPKKLVMDDPTETGIASVSSHDSGYLKAMVSPQDTTEISLPGNRLPVFLSMLTTYCHLIRLYHAIFTQLYQMFLIISPPEDLRFLLFSNSQYNQIGMDGGLSIQVQRLIELGFDMLAKLEQALELRSELSSESDAAASPRVSMRDKSSLASIREQIVAHEGIISGIPLKETMHCLGQLVKASADS